jgi:hypothetical protein
MKRFLSVCLLAGIGVFQIFAQKANDLTWDIQFQKGRDFEPVPKTQIISVENGQNLSMFISPASDCYCYIISQNSARKIFILHDQPVKGDMEISVDPLCVDNTPGQKTVYVIMSLTKQAKLEESIKNYKSDTSSQKFANSLQAEIAKLQDSVSVLGEPSSALVASGGTTRGMTEEYVTRYSKKDIYVRAITIRSS